MKTFLLRLILGVVCVSSTHAADKSQTATPATARILGEIPDGTPPPTALPKPEFVIPRQDILTAITHEQGGRTITVRQIKPIALPPPPVPVETTAAPLDAEFSQRLAEYRDAHPKSGLLLLGATIYRSKDSPPRTLVRFWPGGNRSPITFWSSADFALIAGGIQSFVDSASNTPQLMMSWGNIDIDHLSKLQAARGRDYEIPDVPDFPDDKATFQITGNPPAAEDLIVIQSLHDLYQAEHARLLTSYQGREQSRLIREAELKANPPQAKDITLNFWRTEKPAKGGAR
jgi:hypothetical protein